MNLSKKKVRYYFEKMNKMYSVPRKEGQTEKEAFKLHLKIANRQTYDQISNKNEIERCIVDNDKKIELSYRFTALLSMISNKVTGDYPALENNHEKLMEDITEYIEILKLNV